MEKAVERGRPEPAMRPSQGALVAIVDPHIYRRLDELLTLADVDFSRALDPQTALGLASGQRFGLVICDLPLAGPDLRDFLARLAGAGSLSAGCAVVLYGRAPGAALFEGAGPVSHCRTLIELLRATARHLELGDRVTHRLLVRMEVEIESARVRRAVQTANLSPSGMLLRTQRPLPVGAIVPFSLDLPADPEPVRGRVEVVRHTDPTVEGMFGMGVRFVELEADGGDRLSGFVSSRRAPGARPA